MSPPTQQVHPAPAGRQLARMLHRRRLAGPEPRGPVRTPAPRLDAELERELVVAAKDDREEARATLVETFTPLIASIARIYRGSSAVNRGELMQEGVVGLLRALERYDPDIGTPFWAYASWWVRQAMQQLVSELTRPVVLSDRAVRHLAHIKDAHRHLVQCNGKEPTVDELAARTGLQRVQVENLIAAERMPRPLEEPIGGDQSAGTFGELLADPRAEDAYDRVPRRMVVESLKGVLGGLTERERLILRGRFGFDGPEQTLRELGLTLGVSAERVRQIEQRALDKLRAVADSSLTPRHPVLPTPVRVIWVCGARSDSETTTNGGVP
jgi:RNA polymerase primary sigma factor